MRPITSWLLLACFLPLLSKATVRLPYFIADNMVLQQNYEPALWGWTNKSKVTVTTSWNKKKYTATPDANGKWKLQVNTPAAGGPYEITISDGDNITLHNVLIGEVWLCSGQSNMEMPLKGFRDQPILGSNDAIFNSTNDHIRLYTVPRSVQKAPLDTSKNSPWKSANPESVNNFSATAYFFGKILYDKLQVPIGLINISYGGSPVEAFMDAASLKDFTDIKIPSPTDTAKLHNRIPTVLYNGMLHPFLGYGIKGCIWYQGESNNERAAQYEKLFPAFVKMLREQSGQGDFPFLFAQIAPYAYNSWTAITNPTANSAFLRDAQRKALAAIPNSGMAVLMDIGEERCIHPADKATGSKRLAMLALAKTYGLKGFTAESPLYDSLSISGSTVTVHFKNAANGLTSFGKPLTHFQVAGSNKIYRPATAMIVQGKLVVTAPDVKEPVAVRYAFDDFVVGELYNTEGFPASSFRTDNW